VNVTTGSAPLPNARPKVELHLHLDCCMSYACVRCLAPEVDLATYRSEFAIEGQCGNLVEFLERTLRMVELMQSPEALRIVVDDLFDQLARDGVVYAEIRFAPFLHTEGGMTAEEVTRTIETAVAAATAASGVEARLILCTLRHYDAGRSMETARLAAAARPRGLVVGFDIAGDEAGHPLDRHVEAFQHARRAGLRITAHAGESRGPDSVVETLDKLAPERIGHGIRSIESAELIDRLIAEDVHLEVCPSSNVHTMGAALPGFAYHPIDALRWAGVSLSVNSDIRGVCEITLSREYERLAAVFGWSATDFADCNRAAIDHSFAPAEVKERLARHWPEEATA
jgi:adenosine deaminase